MSEGLSLSRDRRHRSSSSLGGVLIEATRSERKLDGRESIQEVDEHFAIAEARCNDLQEKINQVKEIKRKRKIKKKSMTRIMDVQESTVNNPILTIRTQPKKKISQQAARLRRLEMPNPTRGYLDPATLEQHQMIGQVRGYNQLYTQPKVDQAKKKTSNVSLKHINGKGLRHQPVRADGDSICSRERTIHQDAFTEVACGDDQNISDYSDNEIYQKQPNLNKKANRKKSPLVHRKPVLIRPAPKLVKTQWRDNGDDSRSGLSTRARRCSHNIHANKSPIYKGNERIVVELFNKNKERNDSTAEPLRNTRDVRQSNFEQKKKKSPERNTRNANARIPEDEATGHLDLSVSESKESKKVFHRNPRKVKYRTRRYELPTVASQMKQAGVRYSYNYNTNYTNIPFVVSKSTAPSHNIGVNIQQVLNGIKIQQPLSGIPLTIAHHMGLGHIANYSSKSTTVQPSLQHNRDINAIKVGRRLLRLPSYKYMSYSRLLSLYREGDGMVPRFLRSISRPHYFYTSMYNLTTDREDLDGATSKGQCAGNQEAKQSLAEYANLYRELEHIEKCLKEGHTDPDWERRRDELTRELAAREEHIRKVVQEYKATVEPDRTILRASASTADEGYRHSSFRLARG